MGRTGAYFQVCPVGLYRDTRLVCCNTLTATNPEKHVLCFNVGNLRVSHAQHRFNVWELVCRICKGTWGIQNDCELPRGSPLSQNLIWFDGTWRAFSNLSRQEINYCVLAFEPLDTPVFGHVRCFLDWCGTQFYLLISGTVLIICIKHFRRNLP